MDMLHIIIRNQHLVHVYTAASYRHTRRPVLYSCAAENALQIVAKLTFLCSPGYCSLPNLVYSCLSAAIHRKAVADATNCGGR